MVSTVPLVPPSATKKVQGSPKNLKTGDKYSRREGSSQVIRGDIIVSTVPDGPPAINFGF